MRIVHLSTYDGLGGATRAVLRLHKGQRNAGIDSHVLVQHKTGNEQTVHGNSTRIGRALAGLSPRLDRLPMILYRRREPHVWSVGWLGNGTVRRTKELKSDLINLHWVGDGFLALKDLPRFNLPVVWTLHDSWAFTGGCHLPFDCVRYRGSCGACPQLASRGAMDLSRWVWKRKNSLWKGVDITIVTPSAWLAESVKTSSLFQDFPVRVIPNGLDLTAFRPIDRRVARDILRLPQDRKIIASGAIGLLDTAHKGPTQLQKAMVKLASTGWNSNADLLLFGASTPEEPLSSSFTTRYAGILHDDVTLALHYSAADVFVCSSLSENLPYTVMESLACGTPVVAFDVGGIPDLVQHEQTGYLARSFDPDDLAEGISWILGTPDIHDILSANARKKVEQSFSIEKVVDQYSALYGERLANSATEA